MPCQAPPGGSIAVDGGCAHPPSLPHRLFNWLVRNRWDTGACLAGLTDLPILFLSALQASLNSGGGVGDARRAWPTSGCCSGSPSRTASASWWSLLGRALRNSFTLHLLTSSGRPMREQDEMLPPHQMEELYRLHPTAPWSITYFPSASLPPIGFQNSESRVQLRQRER